MNAKLNTIFPTFRPSALSLSAVSLSAMSLSAVFFSLALSNASAHAFNNTLSDDLSNNQALSKQLYLAEFNKSELVSPYKSSLQANVPQKNSSHRGSNHPIAESQFLEHVGSVELLFGITQFASSTKNSSAFVVGNAFSLANKNQPFLMNSRLNPLKDKYDISGSTDQESDIYSLGLGMFLQDGLMVGFKYDRTTSRIYNNFSQINTVKSNQYDVFTKFVRKLNNGRALNIEASFAIDSAIDNNRGDNQTINISGDYYVNQHNSIGFGIERISSEQNVLDGDVISLELRSFITPKFSVAAGMEKFSSDNILFTDDRIIDINFNAKF